MLGSVTAYAQLQAMVRALYSKMLSLRTWNSLIQATDYDGTLTILKGTVYAPYLNLDREVLTPRRTVYQIHWHLIRSYTKLIRNAPHPGSQLLLQLWRLFEVDNLKAALRGIEVGAPWNQIRHLLVPVPSVDYVSLTLEDLERMVRSGSVVRAVERIAHTPYYATLVHALERYESEGHVFPLELALDLNYRRGLWESIEALQGKDREEALRMVGTILDNDNLLWAIRFRVYHQLSSQEIINYTLPMGYRVRDEDIRAIARGEEIRKVVARVYPELELWEVPQVQDDGSSRRWLAALELALERYVIRLCRRTFRGAPFHIGLPIAYLQLSEHEIRDLTLLIEAKASGTPQERFRHLLELPTVLAEDSE
ncbi:MAG: V-type ATPase subunit [Anaerolineales bacterium]